MTIENIEFITTSVGLGGITGFLLGYFLRKIIKLILFGVGGILALLMYLQYQGVITVNMTKVQSYTDDIVNTFSNTNGTIESWNHILPSGAANLGIPLTSSMTVGFTVGFLRA
jgi:uncharacterized membrane protein (Fun14 family)